MPFTPRQWVELSQQYIANVLGEDWQEKYYIWDCAAGTGNLLAGLTDKYKIWASTLDKADVDVMKDRIKNGANLLEDHVFKFDFLNDSFDKLPDGLKSIIDDPKKRKQLILYINPPYAEATNKKARGQDRKDGVAKNNSNAHLKNELGAASNELYAHFMARIYLEIEGCHLAMFSKMKYINSHSYKKFRSWFGATFKCGFVVHASTFDNVKGNFPISFTIWQLNGMSFPQHLDFDVVHGPDTKIRLWSDAGNPLNQWIKKYNNKTDESVGILNYIGNDFQQNERVWISINPSISHILTLPISRSSIYSASIYFAVRLCIAPTWLNDRDQFLSPPTDAYLDDSDFINNCLAYTLFHGQNRVSSKHGVNHWIPFTEKEVNSRDDFESNFMSDLLACKSTRLPREVEQLHVFGPEMHSTLASGFSPEATAVFDAGKALWRLYHSMPECNVNASLYDIREHFQGRNTNGKMNNRSNDETYNVLIADLRVALKALAEKITPKIYEYGFLKR